MHNIKTIKKIVITGPESTGKTTLSQKLSKKYSTIFVPEFAREYIENKKGIYTYEDVIYIAKKQIDDLNNNYKNVNKYIFYDTGLIITKIWFLEVFEKVPTFIEEAIQSIKIDLYLLCYPDIKWVKDSVRENGVQQTRLDLFFKYKKELEKNSFKYFIIRGNDKNRFLRANKYLSSAYCLYNT